MTNPARFQIRIPATTAAFLAALPEIHAFAQRQALTRPECYALDVALEEYVTNLIEHGQAHGATPAPRQGDSADASAHPDTVPPAMETEIVISVDAEALCLTLEDAAIAFDPTHRPAPAHLDAPLEQRPIGGLGIHLMRNLFHEVSYQYQGGRNQLHLRYIRPATPPAAE